MSAADAAELLARAADHRGTREDPGSALPLIDRAVALGRDEAPAASLVRALRTRAGILQALGRLGEARAALEEALEVNAAAGDADQARRLRVDVGWLHRAAGRYDEALAEVAAAASARPATPDPFGDVYVAVHHCDLLVARGASAADVLDAARTALKEAAAWGLDSLPLSWLRLTVGSSLLDAGDVTAAGALFDPVTEIAVVPDRQPAHLGRVDLDVRRGRLDDARERLARVAAAGLGSLELRVRWAVLATTAELWSGRPSAGLARLLELLPEVVGDDPADDPVDDPGSVFALAARCAADLPATERPAGVPETLLDLLRAAPRNPFDTPPHPARGAASAAAWAAELARLHGVATVAHWSAAARRWHGLGRPHDAAYACWQGARLALRAGQGTGAARLLARAAAEAGEHVPLVQAVAATRARGR
jgi:tetratricopeptide (TPR) repeat protein